MKEGNGNALPLGWELQRLGDIADINPRLEGCAVYDDDMTVTFVPMRAVDPEGGGFVRPEARPYHEVRKGYTSFRSGDVIMAKITPCMENGKTTVVPDVDGDVCFGSTEFHVIRPRGGIAPSWVARFLLTHHVRRSAQRAMTGAVGQMRVPVSFLESTQIPIAPAAEQARIADAIDELFSDLDTGVAALERVRDKLKLYRASVLKAAVEGTLTAEWRAGHPDTEPASELLGHILVERRCRWEDAQLAKFEAKGKEPPKNWKAKYKEPVGPESAALPPLPGAWCWATLDQLSTVVTSGSRGWKDYYSDEGPLFIRAQDIRTDHLELGGVAHVCPPESSEGVRTRVHQRDLLVTITGANVAKAALVDIELTEAYVSQHVGLVRLVACSVGSFAHIYVVAPSGGRKRLLASAYGAGKPGLNLDNLRELPVPLPPTLEGAAIVDLVEDQLSVLDHLEADIDAKLKSAHSLRQAILHHAFTGQLVPQDPTDEPAAELLKRIAAEREVRSNGARHPRPVHPSKRARKGRRK